MTLLDPTGPSLDRPALDAVDLVRLQLAGLDAWTRRRATALATTSPGSREDRMDVARRQEVLAAQQAGILRRLDAQLEGSAAPLRSGLAARAVVVHKNSWFCSKLVAVLQEGGVEVLEVVGNGAEGLGVVVAEQPELVLVEDVLPMLPGEDVVREARALAPRAVVVAQVDYPERVPALLEAGASAAYTRRVPPVEVAAGMLAQLAPQDALAVVPA